MSVLSAEEAHFIVEEHRRDSLMKNREREEKRTDGRLLLLLK
jgi:hypothetical protein